MCPQSLRHNSDRTHDKLINASPLDSELGQLDPYPPVSLTQLIGPPSGARQEHRRSMLGSSVLFYEVTELHDFWPTVGLPSGQMNPIKVAADWRQHSTVQPVQHVSDKRVER